MNNKSRGITLISLIVTIIILLILAGIVIALTIGENGIIQKAQRTGATYDEQQAKEKLELVLLDMQTEKITNTQYNKDNYLTKKIEENEMSVNGDIVFVDGWQFQIDRNIPQISVSLGKGQANPQIKINVTATTNSDYAKGVIKAEIEYSGDIKYISIAGVDIIVPSKIDGKYVVEKEVTTNGNHVVIAKDIDGKYQIGSIKISDLTEDMNIYNKADFEKVRQLVDSGRTFEGKTVNLMNDVDLEGSQTNQWVPIGNTTNIFKGTFEGNYKVISNLYINSTNNYQALFGNMTNGAIKNTILDNVNITGREYVAGMLAYGENVNIENCGVNGTINSNYDYCAGIVAYINKGNINKCYNKANITINTSIYVTRAAGITSYAIDNVKISNCYNIGNISANASKVLGSLNGCRPSGIVGEIRSNSVVEYSYNKGTIKSTGFITEVAGIAGVTMNSNINQCFNIGVISGAATHANRAGNISSFTYYTSITNCYYVANNIIGYNHGGSSATDNKLDTASNIKNLSLTILGGDASIWEQSGANDGYPTLTWEK